MVRPNLSKRDASEFERYSLDYILEKEKKKKDTTKYLSVEEALQGSTVYKTGSKRDETRVLFISNDESLLNPTKQTLDGYVNISDLFDEVHILILRTGIKARFPVIRVAENVWLYTANSKDWWTTPFAGMIMAEEQLVFAGGFRPDLIVARDPFESAILAYLLRRKYKRPVQIHVLENYTKVDFLKKNKGNYWRRFLTKFTLPRANSIRTLTKTMFNLLKRTVKVKDLEILPRFNNYEALRENPPTLNLREKYKNFVFVMLYVGHLDYDSALIKALDASRFGLKNPRIGLVVIGEGSAQKEFEKRTEVLGIKDQVVFEKENVDVDAYLKSAHVLIIPDTDHESEELVLRGAAAGIPMVMSKTSVREDVFSDGESALLCASDNIDEFSLKLNILMNDVSLRKQMSDNAKEIIETKFHDDPVAYLKTFRESIEQVLFVRDLERRENSGEENFVEEEVLEEDRKSEEDNEGEFLVKSEAKENGKASYN